MRGSLLKLQNFKKVKLIFGHPVGELKGKESSELDRKR